MDRRHLSTAPSFSVLGAKQVQELYGQLDTAHRTHTPTHHSGVLLCTHTLRPLYISGVPRNFVRGGGFSTNSVEDRGQTENGGLGAVAPLVRGSGGSCNLVQGISFHIVKFS
jgi:hypothetical protein